MNHTCNYLWSAQLNSTGPQFKFFEHKYVNIVFFFSFFCEDFISNDTVALSFFMFTDVLLNLQLTSLLAEMGLNIQEAHAFSTVDGYSLDVFVVDGWPYEVLLMT